MSALRPQCRPDPLRRRGGVVRPGRARAVGRGWAAAALPGRPRPEDPRAAGRPRCWNWPPQRGHEPAFGLRMAESRRLSNLGPLALLVRDEPTLRSALEALMHHIHVHNEALAVRVEQVSNLVVVRLELDARRARPRCARPPNWPSASPSACCRSSWARAGSRGWCASRIRRRPAWRCIGACSGRRWSSATSSTASSATPPTSTSPTPAPTR